MSNLLAIAATTATLQNLLHRGGIQTVTTLPPHKARTDVTSQVNLFLYQTIIDAALRNSDMPQHTKPGETAQPPVPLALRYLVTSYGVNDDETESHKLLGKVILTLHDHSLLGRQEILNATDTEVTDDGLLSDLHDQIERVRITPLPMSVEEMSKLWTTFQTNYRISVAYELSVILIESKRATRTPLPVLRRGREDQGVFVQPDLIPPFPTIASVEYPNKQTAAHVGDVITVKGHHLPGLTAKGKLPAPLVIAATGSGVEVQIPISLDPATDSERIPAGMYSLSVIVSSPPNLPAATSEFPIVVAPKIRSIVPRTGPVGPLSLNVQCTPHVLPEQRVSLLFGDQEIIAPVRTTLSNNLTFSVDVKSTGEYHVRLRVDGVDSLLIDQTGDKPRFDPNVKVTIT